MKVTYYQKNRVATFSVPGDTLVINLAENPTVRILRKYRRSIEVYTDRWVVWVGSRI